MMDFPIADLMDGRACYDWLLAQLHPRGLCCPRCGAGEGLHVHDRHRDPLLDYRCRGCRCVFNLFTGTALCKTRRTLPQVVLILRGIARGQPTAQLARELSCSRTHLLALRHRLQENARVRRDRSALAPGEFEADEMYQNAGEKRRAARGPGRPAAPPGQRQARARHLGERPPARPGRGAAGRAPRGQHAAPGGHRR